jgi:sugar/nucleoside kinase (ribokinase family)
MTNLPQARSDKPFDLAIAGELNLDLILYGIPLIMEPERELLGTGFVSTLGSSSAIVAHNAAVLGLRVRFATLVGDDDFGRLALERLAQAGVETTDAIVDPAVSTGVTFLLPHGTVRHSLSYLGSIDALTVEHLNWARLAQARHFHLSSLYLQTGLHRCLLDLLRYLKSSGLTISLDTNGDPADLYGPPLREALPFVDVFLPNETEICRMAGKSDLDRALDVFADQVPAIVVKRGRNGCLVREGDRVAHYPGVRVDPVDTIGAGDSFNAGFLCAFLKGQDIGGSARAGNISGALSTLAAGGTEAFRNQSLRESFLREQGYPMIGD